MSAERFPTVFSPLACLDVVAGACLLDEARKFEKKFPNMEVLAVNLGADYGRDRSLLVKTRGDLFQGTYVEVPFGVWRGWDMSDPRLKKVEDGGADHWAFGPRGPVVEFLEVANG